MGAFQAAMRAVLAPLEFAARDDFAHVGRIRDLRGSVSEALERVLALSIPRDARGALQQVAGAFETPLAGDALVAAVRRALRRLRPFGRPDWSSAALARPASALPGVGPRRAELLGRRGLRCVEDVLFHLPARYDDRRRLDEVGKLEVGLRATFAARVLVSDFAAAARRPGRHRGRVFQAVVGDDTGTVNLKWFHAGDAIARVVRKGARLLVTGEVKRYRFSKELLHPEIELLGEDEPGPTGAPELARVVPDYAAPEGIHPRAMRRLVEAAVGEYADLVEGYLPEALAAEGGLPEPAEALRRVHAPAPDADLAALGEGSDPARTRLVLEELYLLELGLALRRARRSREPAIALRVDGPRSAAAPGRLPFHLTRAQRRAWDEIRADLARPHPMNRLLEGDVGSGKTVIAFLAGLAAAESGTQTALMAPTELLAEQHERTLRRLAGEAGESGRLRVAPLTASLPRAEADAVRRALAAGEVDIVVGTHALVQEGVRFQRLALVVTDEQHRFGVRQRAALAGKAGPREAPGAPAPHTLVMTATPIPRTLALTLHGDLDLSVLDELPPGRAPVRTLLLRAGEGRRVVDLLRETAERGEQIYVVYPLVQESERSDLRAAAESAERIRRAFPEFRVDLVHGRLDAASRAEAMARFESGETRVLVSTTVIEVGVDVQNATLMIVEHAERFGLAQLHQLRGRVGRGDRPSTCVLVARASTEDSEARLDALLRTTDGFQIAEADLRLRGPGQFLGTRQSGRIPDLRLADLARDLHHIARARRAAQGTVEADPGLRGSPELARAVRARWGERLSLAGVG